MNPEITREELIELAKIQTELSANADDLNPWKKRVENATKAIGWVCWLQSRSSREDVLALAVMASDMDYHKEELSDFWKERVKAAVEVMHRVAEKLDAQHDFGIYARED